MEQHPIPQQISSYQFRLVGDMTLKQFFQLAGGFVVALIFYSTPLIGIVKWPFVILSSILGVALAFLPLEERPLERWIFAFFKAIYTPTEYFWQKTQAPPKFFQDEGAAAPTPANPQQDAALKQYLSSTAQRTGFLSKLEGAEQGFLATLTGMVSGMVTQPARSQQTQVPPPPTEAKKEMQIPQVAPVKIVQTGVPRVVVEEKVQPASATPQLTTHQVAPIIVGDEIVSTKQAIFSVDATPPNPPRTPNVVVGQVVDQNRRIIEGAIMEIKDSAGRPIRALRSNKVGHFITVTPLEDGRYDIITEKDGYEFTPVSFDANGVLIPPILVQGRKILETATVPQPALSTKNTNLQ
jgi:hypothetical protein